MSSPHGSISSLPQELISHILGYLDTPQPSASRRVDVPSFDLTRSLTTCHYKNASLVCRQWRRTAVPFLYRHAQIIMVPRPEEALSATRARLCREIAEFLNFVGSARLDRVIESLTVCVQDVQDAERNGELGDVQSSADGGILAGPWYDWRRVLDVIQPVDVSIVASPTLLGGLTGMMTTSSAQEQTAWPFQMRYHLVHLSRQNAQADAKRQHAARDIQESSLCTQTGETASTDTQSATPHFSIFHAAAWTHVLLNEGSFIPVYQHYEYWSYRVPSILPHLVAPGHWPKSCTKLSYIALFPTQTHFVTLTDFLPPVQTLHVQLTPLPGNEVLQDRALMQRMDTRDLWMERNHCYSVIMRELFDVPPQGNWANLEEFESGDAADEDAWQMAVQFVERQGGWHVERPGVFVRAPPPPPPSRTTASTGNGDDGDGPSGTALSVEQSSLR